MTTSSPALAARERAELADLLAALGPDAATCCAGWDTAHLAAHVVVRDSRPDALPGYGLEALPGGQRLGTWSHAVEDRVRAATPYPRLVERVRSGPPPWMPFAWPGVARLANTAEFAIHHEDVRRAQPDWQPRRLSRTDQDELWRNVVVFARSAARGHAGGVRLRRTDTGDARVVGGSSPSATVAGDPLELLLWASGRRDVARVALS